MPDKKKKKSEPGRGGQFAGFYPKLIGLAVVVCLFLCAGIARLVHITVSGDSFADLVSDYTRSRTVTIQANRGEIFDRNGVPLVKNRYSYEIRMNYRLMSADDGEYNALWLKVCEAVAATDSPSFLDTLAFPFDGEDPVALTLIAAESGTAGEEATDGGQAEEKPAGRADSATLQDSREFLLSAVKAARSKEQTAALGDSEPTGEEALAYLRARYVLRDKEGNPLYDPETELLLLRVRYEAEYRRFGSYNPFVVCGDASLSLITYLKEMKLRGVDVVTNASREYCYPGIASHILGRVGPIQAGTAEYYTAQGYALNAIVGISGAEAVFEAQLHGTDGKMTVVEDLYGNVVDQYISVEPVAGQDVWLTIDIGLQQKAEQALADNIAYIVQKAESRPGDLDGEDADSGALTVVNPSSGEVLAMASYPTYNLAAFREEYPLLSADPAAPYLNRALDGCYPPGSTFKPATAIAALEEGVITPDTIIRDEGIYRYYADYQPRCWIYLRSGGTHGPLNLVGAIQHSCNYFFYEVGRQLTIEKLNEYCKKLGLGQPTGIEFKESVGILAGPDYTESNGLGSWGPGDTLQAAIGQSYNTFTPLQLSCYISTLINGGTRYRAHLLSSVHDFLSDTPAYVQEPEVLDRLNLNAEYVRVIKEAMRSVAENGSASSIFGKYDIPMGGKTGTAQISETSSDNAVFVAFAPFDEPELVVSIVVEHGNSGTDTGYAVREIFDYWFKERAQ